jgi:SAM-dependent methyltransferase
MAHAARMRTQADFDRFYGVPDPWGISRAGFRDRVWRRCISKLVSGRRVLELGCGEGHLTRAVFCSAASVSGVDISEIAIRRARARNLSNAIFENADFLTTSFQGYDTITAIECLYYLNGEDQQAFFSKVAREHAGKLLIISAPIIGHNQHRKYFTHRQLLDVLLQNGLSVLRYLNVYRASIIATLAAAFVRLPFCSLLLDYLPTWMIYQRCYIVRA